MVVIVVIPDDVEVAEPLLVVDGVGPVVAPAIVVKVMSFPTMVLEPAVVELIALTR